MLSLTDVWPLFELTLRTPRLELRPVRDDDIPGLAGAALAGIHDPVRTPFAVPWTDVPRQELSANIAKFQWRLRSQLSFDHWHVPFAVLHEGTVIGAQDLTATGFAARKTVETGSWLTSSQQGKGLGKEMRAAVLLFAFDHLGAEFAETSAADWNDASIGVTRALGYEANGVHRVSPRDGQLEDEVGFRLDRNSFVRPAWELIVGGLEQAKTQLLG